MRLTLTALIVVAIVSYASVAICAEPAPAKSTADDQTSVEVTVYNDNLGLVKDTRRISLPTGQGELRFMDVAARIMPETVSVRSKNNSDALSVLEQNYEYDLLNQEKLLDKYVGKKIKLVDENYYTGKREVIDAELLSNNGQPIYRINNEIHLASRGIQVLPELPANLIAKPTLTWLYENTAKTPHEVEVSYLTDGISWKADYVLVVDKADTAADISGWVTLDNKSGATYKDARLTLVAGKVNRAKRPQELYETDGRMYAMAAKAKSDFEEKSFFEYHIYDLQRKTTIKENQTKQLNLIEASGIKTVKEYLIYGVKSYWTFQYSPENPKQPVDVYMTFKNEKSNNLGMPLPAGVVRLYKADDKGSLQFAGEDKIEHTPKDEDVRLKVGEAFDVAAERRQTDFKVVTSSFTANVRAYEAEWEVVIRNHKDADVTIGIIEPLFGSWKVISSSHKYKKLDAATLRFDVPVGKDKEVKVKYRVRIEQ